MKNIHVLPTDKPSRLAYDFYEKFYLLSEDAQFFEFQNLVQNKELYITSNEEIKEGDWFYSTRELIEKAIINYTKEEHFGKIILTTDQDLIKDGVQAIDDEFLEWFVSKANDSGKPIDIVEVVNDIPYKPYPYEIIIPKEEQKQNLIDMMQKDEELGLYDIFNDEKRQGVKDLIDKHKQETLEQVAKRILKKNEVEDGDMILSCTFPNTIKSMIEMAEWQKEQFTIEEQYVGHTIDELDKEYIKGFNEGSAYYIERMYSEEEVLKFTQTILMQYKFGNTDIEQMDLLRETFQLFKKK